MGTGPDVSKGRNPQKEGAFPKRKYSLAGVEKTKAHEKKDPGKAWPGSAGGGEGSEKPSSKVEKSRTTQTKDWKSPE